MALASSLLLRWSPHRKHSTSNLSTSRFVCLYMNVSCFRKVVLKHTLPSLQGRKVQCNLAIAKQPQLPEDRYQSRSEIFPFSILPPPPPPPPSNTIAIAASSSEADRKLFVRGLAWETTSETLRNEFQKYGEIQEADVVRDRKSGKSKGYGFVTFRQRAAIDRALRQPQKTIDVSVVMKTCSLHSVTSIPIGSK